MKRRTKDDRIICVLGETHSSEGGKAQNIAGECDDPDGEHGPQDIGSGCKVRTEDQDTYRLSPNKHSRTEEKNQWLENE